MKIYIEWETFLEDSFKSYFLGQKAKTGYKPERYAKPKDIIHAESLIASKWANKYEVWTPTEIEKRESLFFKSQIYAPAFQSIRTQLEEMQKVRNYIAHKSKDAKSKFEQVVRDRLPGGTIPKNITAGRFLLASDPNLKYPTIYKWYSESLKYASNQIVP